MLCIIGILWYSLSFVNYFPILRILLGHFSIFKSLDNPIKDDQGYMYCD